MPPKRKSIITTRGQKRRQSSQEPSTPPEQGSDDSSAINELRQQVKQLMECQGQMMGMLNRSLTQAETTPNISQPMPPMLTVDPRVPEGLSVQPDVMAASRIVGTGTTIIPGEQHEQQLSLPPNLLFKKSNPIGTRVSQKVKDKIITDQYVDMATLIDHSQATDHSSHSQGEMFIQVADNIIKPVPKKKATQPLDIKQWTKAFHLYMAIYTKAHPQEAPNLLHYLMVIESIAEENGDWRAYDETFRFERAESRAPWERLDSELYTYVTRKAGAGVNFSQIRASAMGHGQVGYDMPAANQTGWFHQGPQAGGMSGSGGSYTGRFQTRSFRSSTSMGDPNMQAFHSQQSWDNSPISTFQYRNAPYYPASSFASRHPRGTCWRFQDGKSCDRACGFTHECDKCGGGHPTDNCRKPSHPASSSRRRAKGRESRQSSEGKSPSRAARSGLADPSQSR